MRDAPASIAFEIGVLSTMPPSTNVWLSIRTGGRTPGMDALATTASSAFPLVIATSRPDVTSAATTQIGMPASSRRSNRRWRATSARNLSGATSESRLPRNPRRPRQRPKREHVACAQRGPHIDQRVEVVEPRIACHPRGVHRADRRAEHEVGVYAARRERLQHAHLDGAVTGAARQHEGRGHAPMLTARASAGRVQASSASGSTVERWGCGRSSV